MLLRYEIGVAILGKLVMAMDEEAKGGRLAKVGESGSHDASFLLDRDTPGVSAWHGDSID